MRPPAPRTVAEGSFAGADDVHFGEGTARLVETASLLTWRVPRLALARRWKTRA